MTHYDRGTFDYPVDKIADECAKTIAYTDLDSFTVRVRAYTEAEKGEVWTKDDAVVREVSVTRIAYVNYLFEGKWKEARMKVPVPLTVGCEYEISVVCGIHHHSGCAQCSAMSAVQHKEHTILPENVLNLLGARFQEEHLLEPRRQVAV